MPKYRVSGFLCVPVSVVLEAADEDAAEEAASRGLVEDAASAIGEDDDWLGMSEWLDSIQVEQA